MVRSRLPVCAALILYSFCLMGRWVKCCGLPMQSYYGCFRFCIVNLTLLYSLDEDKRRAAKPCHYKRKDGPCQ